MAGRAGEAFEHQDSGHQVLSEETRSAVAGVDEARLLAEVASLLEDLHRGGTVRLEMDTDLVGTVGLDSLATVELLDRVEHAFGVRLPEQLLSTARTPRDWWQAVLRASPGGGTGVTAGTWEKPELRRAPVVQVAREGRRAPEERGATEAWPEEARTLAECLTWHATQHPDLVGIRLLGTASRPVFDITYGSLEADAIDCAGSLLARGLVPGGRVAIMLPTCPEYFVVFMGVILAGGVPVPVYPPARLERLEEHLRRQARLLSDAGASVLVTVPEALLVARLVRALVPTLRSVLTPQMLRGSAHAERLPVVAAGDTALIQYTSGSTAEPKGVVLTHEQLLANVRAMGTAANVTNEDVYVSWLPLYHDMGLIGAWHAASLYFGMLLVLMSPLDFLARPARWLEAISEYSGTISAGPNFGFQSCVDRISDEELEGLDLSSWRIAFNGSEPVSPSTTKRFIERFGRIGFRIGTMCPAYGLAEVGVGVAFSPLGRGPRLDSVSRTALARSARAVPVEPDSPDALCLVSCGVPLPGYDLRVRGARGQTLGERREGHVECRGPSATLGYFGNKEASAALWQSGWLDTGDMGYVSDGELFLTGRSKDLVIRAGRNLHPEELERAVGELEDVSEGGVAVFPSRDERLGTERLIVAVETDLADPGKLEKIRSSVLERSVELVGLAPDEVVFTPPGSLERTASGKIRRDATRRAFETGTLGARRPAQAIQIAHLALSGIGPLAHRLAGRVLRGLYGMYVWVLVALISLPLWVVLQLPVPIRWRWGLTRLAGRALCLVSGMRLRVEGEIRVAGAPAVIVSNHPSFVDGLALLLASPRPVAFVSSTDFERQPFVGRFLRRIGCVFVHRDDPANSARDVHELAEIVNSGRTIAVFPEGSIHRVTGLRRFHLGAFAVACAVRCPILPVGISGTREIVPPGSYLARRGSARVSIGHPILPEGDDFGAQVELAERVRDEIASITGEQELNQ